MAITENTTNYVQQFVETQSGGAVTEPVNGSWIVAFCLHLGVTEPVNVSWLQALCNYYGITAPLHGSWTIALAFHFNQQVPINASWWGALASAEGGGVPVDLIWNQVLTLWNNETTLWKDAQAPPAPTNDGGTFTTDLPILTGIASVGNLVSVLVDGYLYENIEPSSASATEGQWSLQTTEKLSGSPSPGTQYQVTTRQYDPSTGLESVADFTDIFIISTTTSVTFDLFDSYGDGWNNAYMYLEQETSPGVWTALDLPNYQIYGRYLSSTYTGTFLKYWDSANPPTGTTGMTFLIYDPLSAPANSPARSWTQLVDTYIFDLNPGNYRLVSGAAGSYPTERTVVVKETIGGATITTVPGQPSWQPGTVLNGGTFTIV